MMAESDISKAIVDYLTNAGVRVCRNNSGGRRVKYGLRICGTNIRSGGPDYIVAPGGIPVVVVRSVAEVREALRQMGDRVFGVEVKDAKKPDPQGDQARWIETMDPWTNARSAVGAANRARPSNLRDGKAKGCMSR